MNRLTPADAAFNGQSDVYMRLANINMKSELFRAFLSDCIRKLALYEDLGTVEELAELVAAKQDCTIKTAYDENGFPYLFEAEGTEAVHIVEILMAEADNRLVVLPCKVGDTVYEPYGNGLFDVSVVNKIAIEICTDMAVYDIDDFGKTVFLTREEAEAALKEQANGTP